MSATRVRTIIETGHTLPPNGPPIWWEIQTEEVEEAIPSRAPRVWLCVWRPCVGGAAELLPRLVPCVCIARCHAQRLCDGAFRVEVC